MAADTYTVSLRIRLQGTGNNNNTWGNFLNSGGLQIIEDSVAGWKTIALAANYSLTTATGATDEARLAMLRFTSTGPWTVTLAAVSKRYDFWNASAYDLPITTGSASITLYAGEKVSIMTDGGSYIGRIVPKDFGGQSLTNVTQISGLIDPTSNQQVATKLYVDNTAFAMAAGSLPGQTGNAGKFLGTDGVTAAWTQPSTSSLSDWTAKRTELIGLAIAL